MTDKQLHHLELKSAFDIRDGDLELEGERGPITSKGLEWVGKISECCFETWGKAKSGAAARLGKLALSQNTLIGHLNTHVQSAKWELMMRVDVVLPNTIFFWLGFLSPGGDWNSDLNQSPFPST